MISIEEYKQNPCEALSIPYWKATDIIIPDNVKIIHNKNFDETLLEKYSDKQYFRLIHRLNYVPDFSNNDFTYKMLSKEKTNEIKKLLNDNKKVMIFLRDNTIITDKVYLNIESFDGNKKSIKELLNNSDYYDAILSNENFILNRDIDLTKMYVIYILIILSIVTIILDIYYINNPKKTNTYKKYMKKLYI